MKTNKGFSLIEVLVTLVLTAVGVLGMFVLQSRSISYTQDTVQREQAITAVNDLVETLRVYRSDLYEHVPDYGDRSTNTKIASAEYYKGLKSTTGLYANGEVSLTKPASCDNANGSLTERTGCWWIRNSLVLPSLEIETLCPTVNGSSCAGTAYQGNSLLVGVSWEGRDEMCAEEVQNDDGTKTEEQICRYSVMVEL